MDGRIRAIMATTSGARVPTTQQQRGIIFRGRPAPQLPVPILPFTRLFVTQSQIYVLTELGQFGQFMAVLPETKVSTAILPAGSLIFSNSSQAIYVPILFGGGI
jgi:hypothetical protein